MGTINYGDGVDFCVPTGNFGNILAGYYAKEMGLPIRRLICASNKNNVLTDFFNSGKYDKNREFHKTMSPSMDILISSNLERFLFEMSGRNSEKIVRWYESLDRNGGFSVDAGVTERMRGLIEARWVDEGEVLKTIGSVYRESKYVIDTHTAVGVAAVAGINNNDVPVIITSTASPYKFAPDVLAGLGIKVNGDEFESIKTLSSSGAGPVHRAVDGLTEKKVLHDRVIDIGEMRETVERLI
jgi:threonine synthase